jgi:hypothetical protein
MNDASQGQAPAPVQPEEQRVGSNTWARLGIFGAFAVVFVIVSSQFLIPAGANVEKSVETITRMALQAGLGGWALCWTISGKWLTLKKTALIAAAIYVGLGLWVWYSAS